MMTRVKIKKPNDMGLAVRRLLVFALPALVLAVAVGGNLAMSAFKPKPEEKEETVKATPVVVTEAVAETARLTITAQGEVRPRKEINLASQVSGKISYVSPEFIEGGEFEKGDVLIKVEPAEYEYRVIQARSNVAQARSRFASEEAETKIARKDWEELGSGEGSPLALREPQMAEAAAQLASAEAVLHEAELQLSRTSIKAPFKGRVRRKAVDMGGYVTAGMQLGEIFSTDIMEVALPLTDAELGQLGLQVGFRETENNPGPDATLTALVAGEPRVWRGRLARTDSGYNRETRVLFAYVEVEDAYGAGADNGAPLADGLFVTVDAEGREIDNAVIVPRAALRGVDEMYVARDDDTLEIRHVTVANSSRTRVVLTSGVRPGERVIISPVRGAADGIELAIAGPPAETVANNVAEVTN
ncbi:efflux RND transporter periplasmic adaptor subunit [Hyphococcus sp.]|uniref:efflux RND transporter periplasmic adaptor subunit n=1 Tax=Hyphococcus sp. TaxID=2038636 RepID=UPI00208B6098|nr:MAG: acriflavin resistance protein [Marinicaulis sp.]